MAAGHGVRVYSRQRKNIPKKAGAQDRVHRVFQEDASERRSSALTMCSN